MFAIVTNVCGAFKKLHLNLTTQDFHVFMKFPKLVLDTHFSALLKNWVGLGTHLFVKVPRPGDSDVTFSVLKSSCHLLLPI